MEGFLIEDVDEKSMQILAFFEGEEYEKRKVPVFPKGKLNATAFIWVGDNGLLEAKDWDKIEFKKRSLKYYLEKVVPQTLADFRVLNL